MEIKKGRTVDVGGLILEDCSSYDKLNEKQIMDKTKDNLSHIY